MKRKLKRELNSKKEKDQKHIIKFEDVFSKKAVGEDYIQIQNRLLKVNSAIKELISEKENLEGILKYFNSKGLKVEFKQAEAVKQKIPEQDKEKKNAGKNDSD